MTASPAPAPPDPRTLRQAMGRFATGVAVITTEHAGHRHGMTVNSLTSVSLEPPMLLVCLTRGSRTADAVVRAGRFGVNILSARQEAISNRFARRGEDHFADVPLDEGPLGLPLISNAVAQVTCRVSREIDGGDHVIVLGDVVHVHHRDGLPLCFFSGNYGDFHDTGHSAEFWYF
jgi:flavin reductase (DIM6/NTAB) family NADH-FMN oxidoreductase RutF